MEKYLFKSYSKKRNVDKKPWLISYEKGFIPFYFIMKLSENNCSTFCITFWVTTLLNVAFSNFGFVIYSSRENRRYA